MRKIINAEQTRAADAYTIKNEPVSSIDLMERASQAFVTQLIHDLSLDHSILVVCSTGNNGGDGLAITRLLLNKGCQVKSFFIRFSKKLSPDCQSNLNRLEESEVREITDVRSLDLMGFDIVIDAIFGSGLNRSVTGLAAKVISKINDSGIPIVSVDIPSGLMTDEIALEGPIIQADKTITFQRPKLTFMLPETGSYVNQWHAVDIGLDESFINSQQSDFYYQEQEDVHQLCPSRNKFQHKGDFGRVQVFAGSIGKIGAAFLCAKAVLRVGAGLLTVHVPKIGNEILQTSLPEAMLTLDSEEQVITDGKLLGNTDVVCIGPGLGQDEQTKFWLSQVLRNSVCPLVLDADALNLIAKMPSGYKCIPEGSVITPHVGEFQRLFGEHKTSLHRLETLKKVCTAQKLVVVLKGAHSAIGLPTGEIVFNSTGNVGMSTAGSGDVLSGIITGLIAQGLSSGDAARLGVWLHGNAGDLAKIKYGEMSLMASDLLNELPNAINKVRLATFI